MFTAKTSHSGKLKALFEVLFSNASTVCFTIDANGIASETVTTNDTLISVSLPADAFDEYSYSFDEPQHVGLGSGVHSFFKSLKNRTAIVLSMTQPYTLDVSATDDGCDVVYSVAVSCAQSVFPAPAIDYDVNGTAISCANFNAMCKSISKSTTVDVTRKEGQLSFSFAPSCISSETQTFGQRNKTDSFLFHKQYNADAFVRIGKLASFAKINGIHVYVRADAPLLVEAASQLGVVKVYMSYAQPSN